MRLSKQHILTLLGTVVSLAAAGAAVTAIGVVTGCFDLNQLTGKVDPRTPQDIDGDGIANELDDDMDGDGLPNDLDPDADSDGRFDRSITIDFPFDHNALIKPLLPPNHPQFDFSGRVVIPKGHIDITDIIRAHLADHPMEVFQPRTQDQIASQPGTDSGQ